MYVCVSLCFAHFSVFSLKSHVHRFGQHNTYLRRSTRCRPTILVMEPLDKNDRIGKRRNVQVVQTAKRMALCEHTQPHTLAHITQHCQKKKKRATKERDMSCGREWTWNKHKLKSAEITLCGACADSPMSVFTFMVAMCARVGEVRM